MIQGHRVIIIVPYGRRRYIEILSRYLRRDLDDGVDEVVFWKNTRDAKDLEYLEALLSQVARFKARALPTWAETRTDVLQRVAPLFVEFAEPGVVYVKCDDDVVFIERGAIRRLVEFKLREPGRYGVVSANTVNSGPLVHIHQRLGAMRVGEVIYSYGYQEVMRFPNPIHEDFLRNYQENALHKYKVFDTYTYFYRERWSINCICWMASDLSADDRLALLTMSDEKFLTEKYEIHHPGKHAVVCGSALVVHFAFGPQRPHINEAEFLARYAEISERETSQERGTSRADTQT
jgi:hypothetical protein